MSAWILPLNSPDLTLADAGGKGANLSRLIRGGFQVPGGFVVTTGAYQQFVAENGLASVIAAIWDRLNPSDLHTYTAAARQIRDLFAGGRIPPEIRAAILAAYAERIPVDATVAVRSSATVADREDASFAGQQETYLNVVGGESLLSSVVKCWSSLWTAHALAYRMQRQISPAQVSMAVVVQLMIPARMSGVLFTINPVTSDPEQMVINAVWGLGSILVEGQVTPDTFIADRSTGDMVDAQVADKGIMLALEDGHLEEVDVEPGQRRKPCLSELHVSALVKVGRQLEAFFGRPQDVEWAILRSRLYVLQSRPITATGGFLSLAAPGDDDWPPLRAEKPHTYDLWTQTGLGARWPKPVTPLTWSTWQPVIEQDLQQRFGRLKDRSVEEIEWLHRAYGRVYLNEGALAHAWHRGYGIPASSVAEGLGRTPELARRYEGWRWGTVLRRAPLILGMILEREQQIKQFERDFPQIERWVDAFMDRDLSVASDAELWREAQDVWWARVKTYLSCHSTVTTASMNAYAQMESLLNRWTGDAVLLHRLVAGLTGVIQAEIEPAFWEIARALAQQGFAAPLSDGSLEEVLSQLARDPQAEPVRARLARFLHRHGHRCAIEFEWFYPRWVEEPAQVIAQVANHLRLREGFDPQEGQQRQQREETTRLIAGKLNLLQQIYFRWRLQRFHRLLRVRDNGQHYLVKLVLPIRRVYATLGERWADRNWLAQPDDFFFLAVPEIGAMLNPHPGPSPYTEEGALDLKRIVRERRAAWQYWMAQPAFPDMLAADGRPVLTLSPGVEGQTLSGIAASSGRVEGRARVVLSSAAATDLKPGEILVTRTIDPGWAPLFSVIGGLVLEIGGQLSHGAIVAREYGLPTVVNVPGATYKIRDGQRVTVDGSAGKVYWN